MVPIAKFRLPRQVRLNDVDATGFAHFSTYVRMMEETEYAFLRERGLCVVLHDANGTMGFPRLRTAVQIHRPLQLDQNVVVNLELTHFDGKQLHYRFQIVDDQSHLCVDGTFEVACCRFPDDGPPFAVLIPQQVEQALLN